jgi:uncharacterized protein (DUF2235 family)
MPKNIVILSDGTGNTAIKGRGTNVFKLFEAIDLNGHRFDPNLPPQVAIYDDGVGTESFKPLKILAGATGFGLSRNVKQLYKELCRVYDPGDRIFLFGFSRGAFTVRTLGGLICTCGIVNAAEQKTAGDLEHAVNQAYRAYRKRYRTALMELFLGKPDGKATERFREANCHRGDTRIAFIGVWDTVDAVGLPFHISDVINTVFYRFKFPDYSLSDKVDRACHALAIDDERHSFHPLLWNERNEKRGAEPRVEQVWFAGAHSNVGGGYPKQGMSLVALDWMMQKAEEAELRVADDGLRILEEDRRYCREHANVDDKLYDPRAGLGIFYRWKPRDIGRICTENGLQPEIHLSVLERIAHGTEDYSPGNLPQNARVVVTRTGDMAKDDTAEERAKAAQSVLASQPPLLDRVKSAVIVGRISYYVYLLACIAFLVAAATPREEVALFSPWFFKHAALLVGNLLTSPVDTAIGMVKRLLDDPVLLAWLAGGFVAAYLLALYADQRMSYVFSRHWFGEQQQLRSALKKARQAAKVRGDTVIDHGAAVRAAGGYADIKAPPRPAS